MRIGTTGTMRAGAAAARTWIGQHAGPGPRLRRAGNPAATACPRCHAEPARARRLAQGLDALLCDGAQVSGLSRALTAARAFAEGNGLLAGQRVDRRA